MGGDEREELPHPAHIRFAALGDLRAKAEQVVAADPLGDALRRDLLGGALSLCRGYMEHQPRVMGVRLAKCRFEGSPPRDEHTVDRGMLSHPALKRLIRAARQPGEHALAWREQHISSRDRWRQAQAPHQHERRR
jgi:hypothetical protein